MPNFDVTENIGKKLSKNDLQKRPKTTKKRPENEHVITIIFKIQILIISIFFRRLTEKPRFGFKLCNG